MPGIDYSKWDKLCDSDDSDDSDNGHPFRSRVTKLDYPSRVVVGPNGVHMEATPPIATQSPFCPSHSSHSSTARTAPAEEAQNTVRPAVDAARDDQTEEDDMIYANLTRNGGKEGDSHLWAQTRDTASVSFIMPSMQTRPKDICNFNLAIEDQPDHTSRGVISFHLMGREPSHYVLRYPVKVNEDIVMGCWQLHSLPTRGLRLITVQLVKETIALGATLWWDRCFVTDTTTTDTRTIEGRSDAAAERATEFQRVWAQAHEDFKRRVKEKRAPHVLEDE